MSNSLLLFKYTQVYFKGIRENTKHFDSVVKCAWDIANRNFVTSELWPHFQIKVKVTDTIFAFWIPRRGLPPHLEFISLHIHTYTHIYTYHTDARVHYPVERKRYSSVLLRIRKEDNSAVKGAQRRQIRTVIYSFAIDTFKKSWDQDREFWRKSRDHVQDFTQMSRDRDQDELRERSEQQQDTHQLVEHRKFIVWSYPVWL